MNRRQKALWRLIKPKRKRRIPPVWNNIEIYFGGIKFEDVKNISWCRK